MPHPTIAHGKNAAFLRNAFTDRLLAASPDSLLDVGCGKGELLQACHAAGVWAVGLEPSALLAGARPPGSHQPAVLRGRAEWLPILDRAFDWAVMRHVPHHLADPRQGLRELVRVARKGVLVAEPWHPQDDPAHATAHALDDWCKSHHRRRGRVHAPDIPAQQLADWLKQSGCFEISIESLSRPLYVPVDEVAADVADAVQDLPPDHQAQLEARAWLEEAQRTGVAANGTAMVMARRC